MARMKTTLTVCEIFRSIQGEGTRAGLPCVLVRLAGCNLRCAWCDTKYAWEGGQEMSIADVIARVGEMNCPRVEITGGEPLTQPAVVELMKEFCKAGYETLLETNGTQDISGIDPRVTRIVDVKCPSSGASDAMRWGNIPLLTPWDEVKFVLADRADYEYARGVVMDHELTEACPVIFSPVYEQMSAAEIADWVLDDDLNVRVGLQLHRILWPDKDRGV